MPIFQDHAICFAIKHFDWLWINKDLFYNWMLKENYSWLLSSRDPHTDNWIYLHLTSCQMIHFLTLSGPQIELCFRLEFKPYCRSPYYSCWFHCSVQCSILLHYFLHKDKAQLQTIKTAYLNVTNNLPATGKGCYWANGWNMGEMEQSHSDLADVKIIHKTCSLCMVAIYIG